MNKRWFTLGRCRFEPNKHIDISSADCLHECFGRMWVNGATGTEALLKRLCIFVFKCQAVPDTEKILLLRYGIARDTNFGV